MIDLENALKIWRLTEQGRPIPISHRRVLDDLTSVASPMTAQELLNYLRKENYVESNVYGEYQLTERGIQLRKTIPDVYVVKHAERTGHEWTRFRKLLSYYMDCVYLQERSQQYLFDKDDNKQYFVPVLPYNWLKELGNESEFSIRITKKSVPAYNLLLSRNDEDEDIYIGYPISAFRNKADDKTCYSPIGLIPIDIKECSRTEMHIKLRLEEAEINQQWVDFSFPREERNTFINTVLSLHRNDAFRGMIDLKAALPYISAETELEPNHLEYVVPRISSGEPGRICNVPLLFVGKALRFSKNLKRELQYIRDCVSDEDLDSTALAYVFREPALEAVPQENTYMPLPFIDSNQEQMSAVKSALNKPSTKVTGPPGTGKSQVAVNIIANLIYNGKSVLFTSKNHKALAAIAERSQSVSGSSGLDLVNFCSNEDNSSVNPWYSQDLDLTASKVQGLPYESMAEAPEIVADAASRWQELEKLFSERGKILHEYEGLQGRYERDELSMHRLFPADSEEFYTRENVKKLKKAVAGLSDKLSFSLFHLFKWLGWHLYGEKRDAESRDFMNTYFPEAMDKYISVDEIKKKFKEFKQIFDDREKSERSMEDLKKKAETLHSVEWIRKHFQCCLADIKKHLYDSMVYRRCSKIQELIEHREVMDKLSNIMSVLESAKSPYFFRRVEHDLTNKAEKGFKLFASYFPGWATTLLSMTKASPCRPHMFDCVIIDEASQCEIPPMIPALFRARSVVLIGDPNQFPPVRDLKSLRNDYLKSKNHITELEDQRFDFLCHSAYDLSREVPILLKEHFRCAGDIASFFNDAFYSNQLCVRTNEKKLKFPACMGYKRAVQWLDVKNSFEQETETVKKTVSKLQNNGYQGSIGVITPLRENANKLKQALYSMNKDESILVDTANAFQGGERDVIIFVLGYTDELKKGQLWYEESSENRYIYNVAASRARACLIIVGDKERCAQSPSEILRKLASMPKEHPEAEAGSRTKFDSIWEEKFYNALAAEGIEAMPQYPVDGRRLDLAVIKGDLKIDIEVDGVHWHTNAEGGRKHDDIFRDLQIGGQGWIVMRFWVYELKDDMELCVSKVKETLEEALHDEAYK